MAEAETFHQLPITYSADTKSTIATSANDASLNHELSALNNLHKSLTAPNSDAQNGIAPPPNVVNPKRSANITKLKESGNAAFRAQKYGDAVRMYSLAIDMALGRPLWEPSGLVREEVSALYANRAQAHIAGQNWPEGAVDAKCSAELKNSGNVKAYWRRGKCLMEMGRLEEADGWLSESLEFEGNDAELVELLNEVRAKTGDGRKIKV